MSAEAAAGVRTWSVGRYTATLTIPRPRPGATLAASVEWLPEMPERLTEAEVAEYVRGRNQALLELSVELGLRAVVVDL